MGEFGFWMFCSVAVFSVLIYMLAQLRNEHELRLKREVLTHINELTEED